MTHDRAQGHLLKQAAVVAEGIVDQQVVVGGGGNGLALDIAVLVGYDEQLAEGEGDALAQLIGAVDGMQPPGLLATVLVDIEAGRLLGFHVRAFMRGGLRGLVGEPGVVAHPPQPGDFVWRRAERGLGQEAGRVGIGPGAFGVIVEAAVKDVIACP